MTIATIDIGHKKMICFTGKIHEGGHLTCNFPLINDIYKYLAQIGSTLYEPTIIKKLLPPL